MDNWTQTDEPLLQLISAGHETWRHGDGYGFDCLRRLPPRRVVLQCTLSGTAFHAREGKRSLVGPGQAFIDVLPGAWSYGIAPEASEPYEQVFVAFAGGMAFDLAGRIIDRFGHVLSLGTDSPVVAPMIELGTMFVKGQTGDRYQVSGRIYSICMQVLSQLGKRETRTCPVVGAALAMIRERADDPGFNVELMVRRLGWSRSHVTRRFIAATAVTPLQYLIQYRLDRARHLLWTTDKPIRQVAASCGFASDNYFCRVFRQRYRITPMADRRAARS